MTAPRLNPARLHVFTDFDGTITEADTLVFLTERLGAGPAQVARTTRLLQAGEMSLRDALTEDTATIRAPFEDAVRLLRAHIAMDETVGDFARWCAGHAIPLTVLSAGFVEIVQLYLDPVRFPGLDIRANTLLPDERTGWRCVFRDGSVFGHDKAEVVREVQRRGRHTIFIGDGLSDRAPAEVAAEVFAKPGLAAYCRARGIPCEEFRSFADVRASLETRLSSP